MDYEIAWLFRQSSSAILSEDINWLHDLEYVMIEKEVQPVQVQHEDIDLPSVNECVNKVLRYLHKDENRIIGIVGPFGIGKTTVMRKLNDQLKDTASLLSKGNIRLKFDIVITITYSKELDAEDMTIEKLQDVVMEQLKHNGEKANSIKQNADIISTALRHKKYILLIDQVYSTIDLNEVGIRRDHKFGKVVVASSRDKVIRQMAGQPVEVQPLSIDEALYLFQKLCGKIYDARFKDSACEIVKSCGGLPLAIKVVATCLKGMRNAHVRSDVKRVFQSEDDDSSSTITEPVSSISPDGGSRRVISKWQKGNFLGHGSFGYVFEGIADDGFVFAVKEVSLLGQEHGEMQSIVQLKQEIALLSQFEHENIVQYYGTQKDESHLYIFLELVDQGSLLSLYRKCQLQDSQVRSYARQILHGLVYLHDRAVVHRDIKCSNILVGTNDLVKLADFGLSKALNDVMSCQGTVRWMAPEVVRCEGYGLAADIWSLGCTVLEMLTRCVPYPNLEWVAALYKTSIGVRPDIPDTLSSDARDFILKCLEVDASLRPTAKQLLDHPFVKQSLESSSC